MIERLVRGNLSFTGFEWAEYSGNDNVVDKFSTADWHKIFPMYHSENEFRRYVAETGSVTKVLLLRNTASGEALAFVALLLVGPGTVAVHGGSWSTGIGARMAIYRGFFLLLDVLLNNGAKIVSSSADNPPVLKFLKSFGFRIFSYRYGRTHYHLTMKMMHKSPLSRRFLRFTNDE